MPQSYAIALTIAVFVLAIVLFWLLGFHFDIDNGWIAVGGPVLVLLIAIGMMFWSLNDNYNHVTSGTVVNSSFTPEHRTPDTITFVNKSPIIISGTWIADDWAILVKNSDGKQGWIHFSTDPTNTYPVGSHYPHD